MSWTIEYFGESLTTKSGSKPTKEVLANKKLVGIYFSAHWCPPCRGFTPILAEFYNDLIADSADSLEIIFVSSDSDDASFDAYYGEMSWSALPFSERGKKATLSEKFGVRGIPTFIVLDAETGDVKDASARTTVTGAKGDIAAALKTWA